MINYENVTKKTQNIKKKNKKTTYNGHQFLTIHIDYL